MEGEVFELTSEEAKKKLKIVQFLAEPCDRKTYGQRLRDAANQLDCSIRSVQRLMARWEEQGIAALEKQCRKDKGDRRVSKEWHDFIIQEHSGGKRTPAQVFTRVRCKARQEGLESHPSHMTVYRILNPVIQRKEEKEKIRNVGWKGSRLALKTRDGESLDIEHSNQVWQCDHTKADIMLVDRHGELLGRPILTTVVDTYSRAIMGINLGFEGPNSKVVALALRHAILPKRYNPGYRLYEEWQAYGTPTYLFTDGGKDFRSNHLEQIGTQLGFSLYLRDRPSEGGIVERPFGTFNTKFFSELPGYTGSNVQERPKNVEKDASLTLLDLERLLVSYIVNSYNQRIDKRMGNQTRIGRWRAGLLQEPNIPLERDLDICLMKQTRRSIYRGGYLQFSNLNYRGENLAAHAGKQVFIRYDPRDITSVLVYQSNSLDDARQELLGIASAQGLEGQKLSLEEAKADSRRIRDEGKKADNQSILDEVIDREAFVQEKKKTRKQRRKEEQSFIQPELYQPKSEESKLKDDSSQEIDESQQNSDQKPKIQKPSVTELSDSKPGGSPPKKKVEIPKYEVWDFDDED